MKDYRQIVKENWGYISFRPMQEEIIRSVLEKKDTLGLLPTGGGKSLTFQVPGLAMDDWDRNLYYDYFVKEEGRNPTIVEIRDLDNANSEHSRHGYFRGKQIIDGVAMPETLMEIEAIGVI